MEQLGYSLDQDTLKSALETLKQERSGTFKLFASQRDYKIDYQIIRDEAQEQAALSADHFDEKAEQNLRMHISDIVKRNRNMCW